MGHHSLTRWVKWAHAASALAIAVVFIQKIKAQYKSVVTEKVALSQLKNVAIYIPPFHSCPGQKFVINTKSSVVRLISFS